MISKKKVEFTGSNGDILAGRLELPGSHPVAFVLFAHCFTCGKDSAAASRIARAMVARGYAVLRFDFTGLGGSDGDFSNTNFSSNVEDLVAAADYLRTNYQAPALLVGHSLGGTAALMAADRIEDSVAVVTIGSPADPAHVVNQFCTNLEEISDKGEAEVNLAGRPFTIKKQFIDDAHGFSSANQQRPGKALLVFHSPQDEVVAIAEAEKIYRNAAHPKSFISLDTADHLLSQSADAQYVADTIAIWATRFLPDNPGITIIKDSAVANGLLVEERNHEFTLNLTTDHHFWHADEPVEVGGANLGPDPYEHLLAALGSCTAMTLRMYANRKEWPLDDVTVMLALSGKHIEDCENCPDGKRQVEIIEREIGLQGKLSEQQIERLMEIADRCPVHRTLHSELEVKTRLKQP